MNAKLAKENIFFSVMSSRSKKLQSQRIAIPLVTSCIYDKEN